MCRQRREPWSSELLGESGYKSASGDRAHERHDALPRRGGAAAARAGALRARVDWVRTDVTFQDPGGERGCLPCGRGSENWFHCGAHSWVKILKRANKMTLLLNAFLLSR